MTVLAYEEFASDYAFARLTPEAVAVIASHSPILEVGAGTGWWAAQLSNAGATVVATEPHVAHKRRTWHPMRVMRADDAARVWHDHALLMIWPSRDGDRTSKGAWAHKAVKAYRGDTVIYVGDPEFVESASPALPEALTRGGFTATHVEHVGSWPQVMDDWLIVWSR